MKRVSFKVAKAIKEAGYPQGNENSGDCDVYPLEDHNDNYTEYTRIGKITTRYMCETWRILSTIPYVVAPTYLEVWLWLSRERHSCLSPIYDSEVHKWYIDEFKWKNEYFSDSEEAIISAIEYLCENDLIK